MKPRRNRVRSDKPGGVRAVKGANRQTALDTRSALGGLGSVLADIARAGLTHELREDRPASSTRKQDRPPDSDLRLPRHSKPNRGRSKAP